MLAIFARVALPLLILVGSAGAAHYRRHDLAHKKHHARHGKQSHHREKRHVASLSQMQHESKMLLAGTEAAAEELSDASHRLADMLLDVMSNATTSNATPSALRGASKSSNHSSTMFSANVSTNLKTQQHKLDDLFKHLKLNIANFNKREADSKQDGQEYAKKLQERLEKDHKRLQDASLSAFDHEMLVNRTRMEERELKFWTRGRELQHDMFHSNLKLTHGLMSRVKTVMDAYKQMLTNGKVDPKLTKALHESLPKSFIQRENKLKKDVRRLGKHLKISAMLLHHH